MMPSLETENLKGPLQWLEESYLKIMKKMNNKIMITIIARGFYVEDEVKIA